MRTRAWPPTVDKHLADVAVIGGSGFYEFMSDVDLHEVSTPYGAPSGPIAVGDLSGRRVAFLARHGADHTVPAHRVNYRANLYALHSLGVRSIVAPCSVGSLSAALPPGHMVVLDNLIDRTWGRHDTYFDGDDGVVNHVTFAHPYDGHLRDLALAAGRRLGVPMAPSGTVVVINGPRFSTKAESRWFASAGAVVVNMTQYPEAVLAAELAMAYCGIALVTDYDAGIEGVEDRPVTMEAVMAVMRSNVASVRRVVSSMIEHLD